jgi:hypothetical protein
MIGLNVTELTPPSPETEYARFSMARKPYCNFASSTDQGGIQSTDTPLALIGAAHFSISLLTKCFR